jgi:hypothetical protein
MPQVASGLSIRHVTPQEIRQLLTLMRMAEGEGQIGEKRLALPGRQTERSADAVVGSEPPQKGNF